MKRGLKLVLVLTAGWCLHAAAGALAWAQPPIDWPMFGFDVAHDGFNPHESVLGPASVGNLVTKWTFDTGATGHAAGSIGQPVLAAQVPVGATPVDLLLMGTNQGIFYALDADSANPAGTVIWQHQLPRATGCRNTPAPSDIVGTAAVVRNGSGGGTVYTAANGRVFAFDLASGATQSGWPADGLAIPNLASPATDGTFYSGVTPWQGTFYVTTASGYGDKVPYYGEITKIGAASATVLAQWFSLSGSAMQPTKNGGGIWGSGGVSIDTTKGAVNLYTATGNPLPDLTSNSVPPALYGQAVVQLSPNLKQVRAYDQPLPWKNDNDFGMSALLFHTVNCPGLMVAAGKKNGTFAIYHAGLLMRQLLQMKAITATVPMIGAAAFDDGTQLLLVANPGEMAPFTRGLTALQADSSCQFSLA